MSGPLHGIRVIELAGIGPGPFAAMMLADMGADVIRVDRAANDNDVRNTDVRSIVRRGRRSIVLDLKHPQGLEVALDLVTNADVLIEGFRPGVTERLGLGPSDCHSRNARLVYARMTGWGQDGPRAMTAGHDINYIAVTGVLNNSRRAGERPVPPMNLLGDMGGGALYLVFGIACALLEARTSGKGQVIDAAIVDGTASLANYILGMRASGVWPNEPGHNRLDTGAPYYEVYTCSDGKEISVGALEPQFYAQLVQLAGATGDVFAADTREQNENWPAGKQAWANLFASRSRDEWTAIFAGSDACTAPVLSFDEAQYEPHLVARRTFVDHHGVVQAAPAPRFSRTPASLERPPALPGQHTDEVLAELGYDPARIADLRTAGAVDGL